VSGSSLARGRALIPYYNLQRGLTAASARGPQLPLRRLYLWAGDFHRPGKRGWEQPRRDVTGGRNPKPRRKSFAFEYERCASAESALARRIKMRE
jgi:hypothetical protein